MLNKLKRIKTRTNNCTRCFISQTTLYGFGKSITSYMLPFLSDGLMACILVISVLNVIMNGQFKKRNVILFSRYDRECLVNRHAKTCIGEIYNFFNAVFILSYLALRIEIVMGLNLHIHFQWNWYLHVSILKIGYQRKSMHKLRRIRFE